MNEIIKLIKMIVDAFSNKPTVDVPNPRVIVNSDNIIYSAGRLTVDNILPDVWLTGVLDTNSMRGLFDYGNTIILSNNPSYLNNIAVSDTVVWYNEDGKGTIHEIVEIGNDGNWFCYTKGIRNSRRDPYKIRRENILWIMLGMFR